MKIKITERGVSLQKIADDLELEGGVNYLKIYHNGYCESSAIVNTADEEIPIGRIILVPDEPMYTLEDTEPLLTEEDLASMAFVDYQKEKPEPEEEEESTRIKSEHDGKYYVIQKGTCQCDKGFKFPNFKVTSHKKHYWNDAQGEDEFLAVTENDIQLDPSAGPFGQCKLRPTSGGYLPCIFAPAGTWQKPYENTKIMGNSCLSEISELMCATGGKITVKKHGQISELGINNVRRANKEEQLLINPFINFEEFLERLEEKKKYYE